MKKPLSELSEFDVQVNFAQGVSRKSSFDIANLITNFEADTILHSPDKAELDSGFPCITRSLIVFQKQGLVLGDEIVRGSLEEGFVAIVQIPEEFRNMSGVALVSNEYELLTEEDPDGAKLKQMVKDKTLLLPGDQVSRLTNLRKVIIRIHLKEVKLVEEFGMNPYFFYRMEPSGTGVGAGAGSPTWKSGMEEAGWRRNVLDPERPYIGRIVRGAIDMRSHGESKAKDAEATRQLDIVDKERQEWNRKWEKAIKYSDKAAQKELEKSRPKPKGLPTLANFGTLHTKHDMVMGGTTDRVFGAIVRRMESGMPKPAKTYRF